MKIIGTILIVLVIVIFFGYLVFKSLYGGNTSFIGGICGGYTSAANYRTCFPGLTCKARQSGIADISGTCQLP
jgi:hypothetical protein